ncbi:Short-chain dehydrogenase [Belliella buryatensis]|uniref:Short-chain dehydrogenase n=1 Tax=Belliella buryatensis TaxID=1500549 RepID=A0A239F2A5_9BACT|nr:SDR family oxidoreductase [Belliella buryatensis]SNS50244.1 Short-chain dehydrogenase [Belliella buryatensis]
MIDSVVWITGASSGIGEALVKTYHQAGWKIIISSRKKEALENLKATCQNTGNIYVLPLDLADSSQFTEIVTDAIKAFGHIDILINNGGISQRSLALDTSIEVDRKIMEIDFFGTIALSKAILPHFVERKSGHFGVVSSLVGKFGSPYRSSYSAAKHALHGFFDSLRAEIYKENIWVTMICPGFIRTNVSINALTADGTPLNEMDEAQDKGMSPEDCAQAIKKALDRKKEEVLIGGKEVLAVYLKRFFPKVFSKLIRKAKVR